MNDIPSNPADWITKQEAADLLDCNPSSIWRHGTPWEPQPAAYKIRFSYNLLGKRKFYKPDIFIRQLPKPPKKSRGPKQMKLFAASAGANPGPSAASQDQRDPENLLRYVRRIDQAQGANGPA